MFGGLVAGTREDDTWAWDGSSWTQLATTGPPARYSNELAFDAIRGEAILFGGNSPRGFAPVAADDTWVFDGTAWTQATPATVPPPRHHHALAFDIARDRVVMFGGNPGSGATYLDDTWEWQGNDWIQRFPAHRPSPRYAAAMCYDSDRQRMVLFGGYGSGNPNLGDTWEYDGNDWLDVTPASGPPGGFDVQLTCDAARRRTVLFGGEGQTWEWDGSAWAQRFAAGSPSGRRSGQMVFDAVRARTVLFGGTNAGVQSGTWEYGPTHPAASTGFGNGCPGSTGTATLSLATASLPWLGTTITLVAQPAAAPEVGVLVVGSNTTWQGASLPVSLNAVGMTGRELSVAPDVSLLMSGGAGATTLLLPLPNQPSLLGTEHHFQSASWDPAANPFGATTTNGVSLLLGGI